MSVLALLAGAVSPGPAGAARAAHDASASSPRGQWPSSRRAHPHGPRARAAIVGGTQISIAQAPWQVVVLTEKALCGGSIIDSTHVLTAAHCATDSKHQPLPAESFEVIAGISKLPSEPTEARSGVVHVRVHPYWTGASPDADDVALLQLKEALPTNTSIQPVSPAPAGGGPAEGAALRLTGFGEQSAFEETELDGNLYALSMSVGYSRSCGLEADALLLCASAPGGTACHGDSGGALTSTATPAALFGVIDFVLVPTGEHCPAGTLNGFANVTAAEIGRFVEGSETPPRAPRGGGAVIWGAPSAGRFLACEPGSWSNGPTFTYAFIDSSSGQTLQRGAASSYALSTPDVGRSILCEVQAANEGGTGVGRTPPIGPVSGVTAAPPPAPVPAVPSQPPAARAVEAAISLLSTNLAVRRDASALVRLRCRGTAACRGALALSVSRAVRVAGGRRMRTVRIGSVAYVLAGERVAAVRVKLNATGRALLRARGGLRARLTITLLAAGGPPAQTQVKGVRLLGARTR